MQVSNFIPLFEFCRESAQKKLQKIFEKKNRSQVETVEFAFDLELLFASLTVGDQLITGKLKAVKK